MVHTDFAGGANNISMKYVINPLQPGVAYIYHR